MAPTGPNLLSCDGHAIVDIAEQSGLYEPALGQMRRAPAASDQRRPLAPAAISMKPQTRSSCRLATSGPISIFRSKKRIADAHRIEGGREVRW